MLIKLLITLMVLCVFLFLALFFKREKVIRGVSERRLNQARWQRREWERDHPFGNIDAPEYQKILQVEGGALMLWLSANEHMKDSEVYFTRTNDLTIVVSMIDRTEKS